MFSLTSRLQAVSNASLTAVSALSVLIAVVSIVQLYLGGAWGIAESDILAVKAVALVKNSRSFGGLAGTPKENSRISFDLAADLSPLFNWNTKQVFVALTAEYDGKKPGHHNKVTYWDKILLLKEDAQLNLKNVRAKYSVWDVEKSFRGRNATLKLEWNVQPWVGPLLYGETAPATTFEFARAKAGKK